MTRDEAVQQAIGESRPGLVLADIQLADDSSGIDAVKDILADFEVPVIFITAFPERLLTGERPEPTFLITKPFQRCDGEGGDQPGACSSTPRRFRPESGNRAAGERCRR